MESSQLLFILTLVLIAKKFYTNVKQMNDAVTVLTPKDAYFKLTCGRLFTKEASLQEDKTDLITKVLNSKPIQFFCAFVI